MFSLSLNAHWPFVHRERRAAGSVMIGWMALGVLVASSSTYTAFAKELSGALSPLSLLFVSELLTFFLALLSFGAVPIGEEALRLKRRHILPLILVGLLSSTAAPLLLFWGLTRTSAVNAALFSHSESVFLIVLAILILRERWTAAHLWSALLITAGIGVIVLQDTWSTFQLQWGDMLIILAGAAWGLGGIVFRQSLTRIAVHLVIAIRSLTAVGVFLLLSPFLQPSFLTQLRRFPLALVPALVGFAFIARFLNLSAFYASLERLPISTVSLVASLSVIGGVLFSAWYLGEPLYWYHILGGLLIILGALMLERFGMHASGEHLKAHLQQRLHHRA